MNWNKWIDIFNNGAEPPSTLTTSEATLVYKVRFPYPSYISISIFHLKVEVIYPT